MWRRRVFIQALPLHKHLVVRKGFRSLPEAAAAATVLCCRRMAAVTPGILRNLGLKNTKSLGEPLGWERWWKEVRRWWHDLKGEGGFSPTHRGSDGALLGLITATADRLRGAGRRSGGAHQMEHVVLVLLWEATRYLPECIRVSHFKPILQQCTFNDSFTRISCTDQHQILIMWLYFWWCHESHWKQ